MAGDRREAPAHGTDADRFAESTEARGFSSRRFLAVRGVPNRGGRVSVPPAEAVQEILDGLPGSAILLAPVLGADGEVTDFRIIAASPDAVDVAGRRGRELVGLSVLETYPSVAGSELWRGYLRVLETGALYEGRPFEYEEVLAGIPRRSRFAVRAAACQGGLLVSWVRLDTGEREQRRLAVMQRLGGMGWADWDLVRDTITWSNEVYVIFGRDRSSGRSPWRSCHSTSSPRTCRHWAGSSSASWERAGRSTMPFASRSPVARFGMCGSWRRPRSTPRAPR
ncbi:hypothetical protein ACH4Q7_35125 [Streptomyces roseolus]|uniref:hypothetical protein n=1 Tax=Streptomyces roseolus TaxID=67358 RepID=UPI003790671D